jgi:hypothetical protein
MKHLLISLCTAALVCAADSPAPLISRGIPVDSSEDAVVTITRVITADDAGATYRSYVFKWKEQDVVIVDNFLQTARKVGDTLSVRVLRYVPPGAQDGRRVMTFAIIPPQRPHSTPPVAAPSAPPRVATPEISAEEQKRRKETMDAEVERRRLLREASAAAIQTEAAPK